MGCGLARPAEGRRARRHGTSTEQAQRHESGNVQTTDVVAGSAGTPQAPRSDLAESRNADSTIARTELCSSTPSAIPPLRVQPRPENGRAGTPSQLNSAASAGPSPPTAARLATTHTAVRSLTPPDTTARPPYQPQPRPTNTRLEAATQVPPPRVSSDFSSRRGGMIGSRNRSGARNQSADGLDQGGPSNTSPRRFNRGNPVATTSTTAFGQSTQFPPELETAAGPSTGPRASQSQPPSDNRRGEWPEAGPSHARGSRDTSATATVATTSAPVTRPLLRQGNPVAVGPGRDTGPQDRIMKIWFETGFMLAAKNQKHSKVTLKDFVVTLATNYNQQNPRPLVEMHPTILPNCSSSDETSRWRLVELEDHQVQTLTQPGSRGSRSPCKSHFTFGADRREYPK
jgi:hypothetical protein